MRCCPHRDREPAKLLKTPRRSVRSLREAKRAILSKRLAQYFKYDHSDCAGFSLLTLCRTFFAADTTVQVLFKRTVDRQQNRVLQKERSLSQCAYFSVGS